MMEKKQNVKTTITEDPIEVIWKANPRIPFMQSKEILAFGYNEGRKSITTKTQVQESVENEGFAGTTKELIAHTDKEVANHKFDSKTNKKTVYRVNELDIEEARYKLLNEIVEFITNDHDLTETYTKVKNMRLSSQKQLRALRNKYGI